MYRNIIKYYKVLQNIQKYCNIVLNKIKIVNSYHFNYIKENEYIKQMEK